MDEHARKAPGSGDMKMEAMVDYLVKPCRNDMEKARVLFSWIAFNVEYDDKSYNSGKYGDNSPLGTYRNGKAVCQGYADLYQAMGNMAGLDSRMIIGYSRGIAYQPGQHFEAPDHAWTAIEINGEWRLFDVTWAAGYGTVKRGKLVSITRFDDYWFNTPAEEFIFSHLPEDSEWQLTETKISLRQYEELPGASSSFFELGFNGESCFEEALEGSLVAFPTTYLNNGSVHAVSLPNSQVIHSGNRIMIVLESDQAASIAVVNNGLWYMLEKDGNEFGAVISPSPGDLSVNANFDSSSNSYSTLLAYKVE